VDYFPCVSLSAMVGVDPWRGGLHSPNVQLDGFAVRPAPARSVERTHLITLSSSIDKWFVAGKTAVKSAVLTKTTFGKQKKVDRLSFCFILAEQAESESDSVACWVGGWSAEWSSAYIDARAARKWHWAWFV
jgi:hypothetical protein